MQDEPHELPKLYDPATVEGAVTARWLANKAFAAEPDDREERYVIMMPLPNVTGALHMGHAMDNVMQDLLIRWHRMRGDNSLWMAGTDHAGIATQAVVEKRLKELEGKTRHDLGRDELIRRIWEWKDHYQERIVRQQQAMGCSCDWDRQRFTMDEVCARAVRHTFFAMFRDGLIYRGDRLVNWDCELQTAVADDELFKKTVQGHFWHLRYPVIDPQPGEPKHIVVATTRPETMLGDTAVACHPEPTRALDELIAATEQKQATASTKDLAGIETELAALRERRSDHAEELETIAAMARDGRRVMLPLQERPIPIICDTWARPELGSGCVKITPAHDPNDYEVWRRHVEEIDIVNLLRPDGTLNENAGSFAGLDRFVARDRVVEALDAAGLVEKIEDREIEIDHSDRSKTIIEPYVSKQWFVRMGDVPGGVVLGKGTDKEFTAPGLAQAAIDAADPEWKSKTGRNLTFHPDPMRYGNLYRQWLAEKRDWCISRQLWWGHRIPVWTGHWTPQQLLSLESLLAPHSARDDVFVWVVLPGDRAVRVQEAIDTLKALGGAAPERIDVQVCFRDKLTEAALESMLSSIGLTADPDVLDTWFSSALWPHSTLGWPDPATAPIDPGQAPLGGNDDRPDCLDYYYPGSCLVTARDIITLWVARMVIMGLYNLGDLPFTDSFIHANIQDGKGNKMSKSAGNGIDPVDIMEQYGADAMRFVMCDLQTGTQDVRLPVQAISPFTGKAIDLATAKHGRTIFTYLCPDSGKEFDVLGSMSEHGIPGARLVSDRFDTGKQFCNKLWNSARFTLMNLGEVDFEPLDHTRLAPADRWILSRLARAVEATHGQLEAYVPSAALGEAREFFWNDLCDWYVEMVKLRLRDAAQAPIARQVLATVLDQTLRLLHPFVPFITEAIWEKLGKQAPRRGVESPFPIAPLLVRSAWPLPPATWRDAALERRFSVAQEAVRRIREIRQSHGVAASQPLEIRLAAEQAARADLDEWLSTIAFLTNASTLSFSDGPKPDDAATAILSGLQIHVLGVVDRDREIAKLERHREKVEAQITGRRAKLDNPGFRAKAPGEVVRREEEALELLQAELETLEKSLESLRSL